MGEKELLDLLKQMSEEEMIYNEEEGYYTNEGSLAWNAIRKAERLKDISIIPILDKLLEKSKDRKTRKNIYFILGKVGENTGDSRVGDILLKWLDKETNKDILEQILNRFAEQSNIQDCLPIIRLINDGRVSIRHSAIQALRACQRSDVEEELIRIINESTDEYDLTYANSVLSEMGSQKAIPYLINKLTYPKEDVKCSALWALNEIGDASLLPIFLETLKDRSSAVKGYAMIGINKYGNETAVQPVIERIKTILKRKRTYESDELVLGLKLLLRFEKEYPEIRELLNWIKVKKWDFLFETEKKVVDEN